MASQPFAGALPPLVWIRWTDVTRASTPSPLWLTTVTSNQGMEFPLGEGTLATALPMTWLPSFAFHDGPAKCLPKDFPSLP